MVTARWKSPVVVAWCDGCAKSVVMATPDEAALLARLTTRAVFRLIEAGLVHYAESREGSVRICLDSLPVR
ncbi:MAG: hypothetical protein H0W76_24835 [Pyrinomonadaceae bacterium]|nr:hypothetical protein [Pyrinomonadaceae bacterium]